jgi:5-formyltetrahydrofolate cyclo-ligase
VVHDDEVLDGSVLPREPHDVPVDAVLTPGGLHLLG